tara:strand:- start:7610 stop:8287 length:678 start_codon:yes stop_codon:yes gene_type:complete
MSISKLFTFVGPTNTSTNFTDINQFDNITNTGVNQTGEGIMELLKTGGEKFKNAAVPIFKDVAGRTIASQALGKAGVKFNPYLGIAGLIFGGLKGGDLLNQPYISGVTTVDQFGNLISGAELDRQNALGGYYTDAARDSRRRDQRIAFMEKRKARLGEEAISAANLARLKAQQAREEAARRAEFNRMMEARRAIADAGSGFDDYGAGQAAGMGFGGGRTDPTDKS